MSLPNNTRLTFVGPICFCVDLILHGLSGVRASKKLVALLAAQEPLDIAVWCLREPLLGKGKSGPHVIFVVFVVFVVVPLATFTIKLLQ